MNHCHLGNNSNHIGASIVQLRRSVLVPPLSHHDSLAYPESLSSYLSRAANNLFYSKNEFIESFVIPRMGADYSLPFLNSGRDTFTINSTGRIARSFEKIFYQLFPRYAHYEFSSFSFLSPLLGEKARGVTSSKLKWCPYCIQRSLTNNIDITYPLYWLASDAQSCLVHKCKLNNQCSHCGSKQDVFIASSQAGICQRCNAYLIENDTAPLEPSSRDIWVTNAINELIRNRYQLKQLSIDQNFKNFVAKLTEQYGGSRQAEQKLCLSESLLRRWLTRNRPKLTQLLDVCYKLQIEPVKILAGEVLSDNLRNITNCHEPYSYSSNKRLCVEVEGIELKIQNYCVFR